MSVRRLYEMPIPNVKLSTRILMVVNSVPSLPDETGALQRRMVAIDFKNPVSDPDSEFERRLETPDCMLGVFLLALIGIIDLDGQGGFIQPESSREPLLLMAGVGSDYQAFAADCIETTNKPEDFVLAAGLHEAFVRYRAHALGRTYSPPTVQQFMKHLINVLRGSER